MSDLPANRDEALARQRRINQHLPDPFTAGVEYEHPLDRRSVWAVEMTTTFAVAVADGYLIQNGASGDFLIKERSGEMYKQERGLFLNTFIPSKVLDKMKLLRPELPPQAAHSENEGKLLDAKKESIP